MYFRGDTMAKDINDILQEGIHGPKEINPVERRKFLGTLRERIVAVLTKAQVQEPGTYKEIEDLMKSHPKAKLLLNGALDYKYLSDYIKLSTKHKTKYTITNDMEQPTHIGLVLAYDYAIDQENIYIGNEHVEDDETDDDKGVFRFLKSFIK